MSLRFVARKILTDRHCKPSATNPLLTNKIHDLHGPWQNKLDVEDASNKLEFSSDASAAPKNTPTLATRGAVADERAAVTQYIDHCAASASPHAI